MLHALIMAGGSGTRLWPESRAGCPKQLLTIEGSRTMIQATLDRLEGLVPPERTLVITGERLAGPIRQQLPQLPPRAVLCEPCPRNTAPCIGLAAVGFLREDPDAVMAALPADHVIRPPQAFREAIAAAVTMIEKEPGCLVTFGVRPTYPATGYGYIERGPRRAGSASAAYTIARFHEKPDRAKAEAYVASGNFYWNAGIFVWRARAILDELARQRPPMAAALARIDAAWDKANFSEVLGREFTAMESMSIDYAVMEGAASAAVIEAPFAWDDVGGWTSVARYLPTDPQGNAVGAQRHVAIEAAGNIVRAADPRHLVVLAGVKDLVVIVTPDATLVADKHDEAAIRRVNEELKKRGLGEYL